MCSVRSNGTSVRSNGNDHSQISNNIFNWIDHNHFRHSKKLNLKFLNIFRSFVKSFRLLCFAIIFVRHRHQFQPNWLQTCLATNQFGRWYRLPTFQSIIFSFLHSTQKNLNLRWFLQYKLVFLNIQHNSSLRRKLLKPHNFSYKISQHYNIYSNFNQNKCPLPHIHAAWFIVLNCIFTKHPLHNFSLNLQLNNWLDISILRIPCLLVMANEAL